MSPKVVKDKVTQLKLSGEASAKGLEDLEVNYAPWSNECVDIYPYKGHPCSLEFMMTKIKESLMWGTAIPHVRCFDHGKYGFSETYGNPHKIQGIPTSGLYYIILYIMFPY